MPCSLTLLKSTISGLMTLPKPDNTPIRLTVPPVFITFSERLQSAAAAHFNHMINVLAAIDGQHFLVPLGCLFMVNDFIHPHRVEAFDFIFVRRCRDSCL